MVNRSISIIIPTLNEEANIGRCLSTLLAQDPEVEIIVSDAGSTDKTLAIVGSFKKVKLISAPRGRALQMNIAAKSSCGEILCFLHADSLIPPSFVSEIGKAFSDPKVSAAFFRYAVDLKALRYRVMEMLVRLRSELLKIPYGDQAICLKKSTFEKLGGYREVAILEDLYLVRALRKQGTLKSIPLELVTLARRYEEKGFLRTVFVHWGLIVTDWFGGSAERFARRFR